MTRFDPSDSQGLGCQADSSWQPAPGAALNAAQKDWLTRGGSLTRHLATLGRVEVQVVDERVGPGWPDEMACLGLSVRTPVWVREVVLSVDGVAMVAAHSIAPLRASRGVWQAMRSLGTRPLAELLYADRTVERSMLVSRRLTARHPLHRYAAHWVDAPAPTLLARRSIFVRGHAPLMVTECLLPALWNKLAKPSASPQECAPDAPGAAAVRPGMRLPDRESEGRGEDMAR